MASKLFDSGTLSTFFGSMATMLSAGIQTDEAAYMLTQNQGSSHFQEVCNGLHASLVRGSTVAEAMECTGAFPRYAIDMVATGERSGHLERVLRNLETYYDEEDRLFAKLRGSVGYPAALLCIMAIIMAFTVTVILPVFSDVYQNMAGSLTAGSFSSVAVSRAVGWAAFAVTVVSAAMALVLVVASKSERGRNRVIRIFERVGFTKRAMYQLALSRFTVALATLVSSGITGEEAMARAVRMVEHKALRAKLEKAAASMADVGNPRSLTQAIAEHDVFEPLYARLLNVGTLSGSADTVLNQLAETFFDDAVLQIDRSLDKVEPILAAFLTVAVGVTLIAVMLPLVGVMGSIG
jgi:type IV pilus assembly protein PilC